MTRRSLFRTLLGATAVAALPVPVDNPTPAWIEQKAWEIIKFDIEQMRRIQMQLSLGIGTLSPKTGGVYGWMQRNQRRF